jgi:protein TonB
MLCLSLSVAAHALVLAGLQTSGRRTGSSDPRHAAPLQIRMVNLASAVPLPDTTPAHQPDAPMADEALPPSPDDVAPAPAQAQAATAEADAPIEAQAQDQPDASTPPLPPKPYAEYIPRPQLSIAPIPRVPILIAPPQGDKEVARRVIVLSLYIDESGHVRHIEADDDGQPPAYVEAARNAFLAATFSPGQLAGQQVKSRTRVEVVFDNTPLDGVQ